MINIKLVTMIFTSGGTVGMALVMIFVVLYIA